MDLQHSNITLTIIMWQTGVQHSFALAKSTSLHFYFEKFLSNTTLYM